MSKDACYIDFRVHLPPHCSSSLVTYCITFAHVMHTVMYYYVPRGGQTDLWNAQIMMIYVELMAVWPRASHVRGCSSVDIEFTVS